MREWLQKAWKWIAASCGAALLLATVYLAGSSRRKGDIELEVAKRELDKANKEYDKAMKSSAAIREKQLKLVSDILLEQNRRAEELKRTQGLTDDEILERLRERGDLSDPSN